jgi:hypothetical protein
MLLKLRWSLQVLKEEIVLTEESPIIIKFWTKAYRQQFYRSSIQAEQLHLVEIRICIKTELLQPIRATASILILRQAEGKGRTLEDQNRELKQIETTTRTCIKLWIILGLIHTKFFLFKKGYQQTRIPLQQLSIRHSWFNLSKINRFKDHHSAVTRQLNLNPSQAPPRLFRRSPRLIFTKRILGVLQPLRASISCLSSNSRSWMPCSISIRWKIQLSRQMPTPTLDVSFNKKSTPSLRRKLLEV